MYIRRSTHHLIHLNLTIERDGSAGNMSFLNIKDPEEKDKTIQEYLTLKRRLKKRSQKERDQWQHHRRDLQDSFEPVVASNKKMAKEIVDELVPITKELRELKDKATIATIPRPIAGVKRNIDSQPVSKQKRSLTRDGPDGPLAESFLEKYMNPSKKSEIDTTFGIRFDKSTGWMIGNKHIRMNGDDITTDDGEVYNGTPGLWSLITSKTPENYTEDDLERYKELLYETSALHQHYDSRDPYPRASAGKKWRQILVPIWNDFVWTGAVSSGDDDADSVDGTLVNSADNGDHSSLYEGSGMKMYLQKNGRCFHLQKSNGMGLTFTPRPQLSGIRGNGLYLRVGSNIYEGNGLLLGPSSPFKNIPILGWIL